MTKNKRIAEVLLSSTDEKFRDFNSRLLPTVDKTVILGVKTPVLRRLARTLGDGEEAAAFMDELPHEYLEENNLHAYLTEQITDFDRCLAAVDRFLPFVDNWATCDTMSPLCFGKSTDRLLPYIESRLRSKDTYTVRFAIVMLMKHFLDSEFEPQQLYLCAKLSADDYYIDTAVAWYYATALAKQYDETVKLFEQRMLDERTHNKALQKAVESLRVPQERKNYLKTLKIKHHKGLAFGNNSIGITPKTENEE